MNLQSQLDELGKMICHSTELSQALRSRLEPVSVPERNATDGQPAVRKRTPGEKPPARAAQDIKQECVSPVCNMLTAIIAMVSEDIERKARMFEALAL